MRRLFILTAVALSLSALPVGAQQAMPEKLQKLVEANLIGDWSEVTEFNGKKFPSVSSWKWNESKSVIVGAWSGVDATTSQIGYLDGENLVFQGQTSNGDFWTTRYNKFGESKWTGHGTGLYEGKPWDSDVSIEWAQDGNSYTYHDTTDGKPFVIKGRRAEVKDPARALRSFARFMVGTWVREVDGVRQEHKYSLVLDKKFVRSDGSNDPQPWDGAFGIDHSNGKIGWWGFFSDGSSGVVHMTSAAANRWEFAGQAHGEDGTFFRRVVIEQDGPRKLHSVVTDTFREKQIVRMETWGKP